MAVFRAPRPAWTRPPPNVIGVSEPTRTAFLFNDSNAPVRGSLVGDPTDGYSSLRATARGKAYYLDGSASDDGRGSANNAAPGFPEHTITMLVRIEAIDATYGGLFTYTSSAGVGNVVSVIRDVSNDYWRYNVDSNVIGKTSAGTVSELEDNQWHWLTFVCSKIADDVKYYVDGVLRDIIPTDIALPTPIVNSAADNELVLGNTRNRSATQQMQGDYAAFYALDRVMSAGEVRHRASPQGQWDWLRTASQRFIETAPAAAATGWEYGAGFDRDPVRIRGNPRAAYLNSANGKDIAGRWPTLKWNS
jgi:hypothetical protein